MINEYETQKLTLGEAALKKLIITLAVLFVLVLVFIWAIRTLIK